MQELFVERKIALYPGVHLNLGNQVPAAIPGGGLNYGKVSTSDIGYRAEKWRSKSTKKIFFPSQFTIFAKFLTPLSSFLQILPV